jgi:sulfur-carrier protein
MQVIVEYTAQARRAVGVSREEVELPQSATLRDLVAEVARRHGEPLERILFDAAGRLHPSILLFVRDEQTRWDSTRSLNERDVVTILSPISGG